MFAKLGHVAVNRTVIHCPPVTVWTLISDNVSKHSCGTGISLVVP